MVSYRISEVSRLLGVSDDTIRRWMDSGRLSAVPGTSPIRIDGASIADYVKEANPHEAEGRVSTRNLFEGLVIEVIKDKVMSQVVMQCGRYRVVSLISTEAVNELGLEPGVVASAQVKATNVSIVMKD
ncbi:MAG: helix-turn-helix domain-containing protein [Ancrocorticia sp.]